MGNYPSSNYPPVNGLDLQDHLDFEVKRLEPLDSGFA